MKIHRKEIREQGPLQFEQVLAIRTVERSFISLLQPITFGFRVLGRSFIAQFTQGLLCFAEVGRRDQEIEIVETSESEISVNSLRQRWSFVRNRSELAVLKLVEDPAELGSK